MAVMRLRRDKYKGIDYKCIFDAKSGFKILSPIVTILAPGPKGEKGWDLIPPKILDNKKHNTILAVNYGVAIAEEMDRPDLEADIWVVTDSDVTTKPWFKHHLENFKGMRCFNLRVIDRCWKNHRYAGPYMQFASKQLMKGPDIHPVTGIIRAGGTVSCSTYQIIHHFAPKPTLVFIVGIDMSGDDYFKGKNLKVKHGPVWRSVHCFNGVIKLFREQKHIIIHTLSETNLMAGDKEFHKLVGAEVTPEDVTKITEGFMKDRREMVRSRGVQERILTP
ncbi:unnamed protein product, partial [marine sediment metagenome]